MSHRIIGPIARPRQGLHQKTHRASQMKPRSRCSGSGGSHAAYVAAQGGDVLGYLHPAPLIWPHLHVLLSQNNHFKSQLNVEISWHA